MDSTKLYQYTEDYKQLINFMEESDGAVTYEDLKDTLDSIVLPAQEKVLNTAKVIMKLQDELEVIKTHKNRIEEMRKSKVKNIESLKQYLLFNMQQLDIKKVDDGLVKVSTRNNKSVEIKDIKSVPKQFLQEKVEVTPMKDEIKKYLNSLSEDERAQVEFADIISKQSLTIK